MALRILGQLLKNGEKPERIMGGLRYVWEKDLTHPQELKKGLSFCLIAIWKLSGESLSRILLWKSWWLIYALFLSLKAKRDFLRWAVFEWMIRFFAALSSCL